LSTYTTILGAIKTKLEGVTGITGGAGKVYDYQRFSTEWNHFLGLFKTTGNKIHGWNLTRVSTEEILQTNNRSERVFVFKIRGYMTIEDAEESEKDFQDIVENICAAFRADMDLGIGSTIEAGDDEHTNGIGVVQVQIVEARSFGGTICHFAELEYKCKTLNSDINV
jgi:hypothetical protein